MSNINSSTPQPFQPFDPNLQKTGAAKSSQKRPIGKAVRSVKFKITTGKGQEVEIQATVKQTNEETSHTYLLLTKENKGKPIRNTKELAKKLGIESSKLTEATKQAVREQATLKSTLIEQRASQKIREEFGYKVKKHQERLQSETFIKIEELENIALKYETPIESAAKTLASDVTNIPKKYLEIKQFASQALGMGISLLIAKKVDPGLTSGVSGEPVFRVFHKESNKLLCVIKAKNEKENILNEINSLKLMKKGKVEGCKFPEPLGVGICTSPEGKKTFLFAQSPAEGKSVDDWIQKYSQNEINEENLKKIIDSMAEAMAGLHNEISKPTSGLANQYNLINLFNSSQLSKATEIRNWIKEIQDTHISCTNLTHGDFHPGNIFFKKGDPPVVTLIDNDAIIETFDTIKSAPKSSGVQEFAFCYEWLNILGTMNHLNPEVMERMQSGFESKYVSCRETPPSPEKLKQELVYMKAYVILQYLNDLETAMKDPSHPWHQNLGKEQLTHLSSLLTHDLTQICQTETSETK